MVPLQSVSVLWDKTIWTETRDTPPALLSIETFCNRTFLKHRTVLLLDFRCCETKMFPTVKHDRYNKNPSQASVDITNFPKHRSVPVRKVLVQWSKTLSTEIVIPPFNPWIISIPESSETKKGSSSKTVGTVGKNSFDEKPWYFPL